MEGKVILLDANGVEIGETFTRRARQLVKQQRAMWADDTHTSIRFAPDTAEEWDMPTEHIPTPSPPPPEKNAALYALAARRLRDRRRMIIHSLALIPFYIITAAFWDAASGWRMTNMGFLSMGIVWGMWTMAYLYRLRHYVREYGNSIRPKDWEGRRRVKLELEVDRLKRMGYSE